MSITSKNLRFNERIYEYDEYGDTRNGNKKDENKKYKHSYNYKEDKRIYYIRLKKEMERKENEMKENDDNEVYEIKRNKKKQIKQKNEEDENYGNNQEQIIKKQKKKKKPKKGRVRL